MDDPCALPVGRGGDMCGVQAEQHIADHSAGQRRRHRLAAPACAGAKLGQRGAVHVLHDQEDAAVALAELEDLHHVPVMHTGRGARLVQ
ncbi:MAG: hypothetical protein WKG00_01955 [Polyangiaceae bacterium]